MNRRKVLLGSGVAFSTILAGCSSDETDNSGDGNGDADGGDETDNSGNGNGDAGDGDENPGSGDGESEDNNDEEESEDDTETVDEPEPQSFSGSGASVEDGVSIEGGLTVVDATHTGGSSNFQVSLVNDSEYDDNFVNAIGEYDGASADLLDADEYMLDVEADGDWDVEIRQPRAASGDSLSQSLSGDSPAVAGPFEFSGSHIASGSHSGSSNFAVQIYPAEGSFGELVFNEIGEYDGETTCNFDGVGWVDVQADGEWAIDLE
ncbi:hypothetical protein [Natronorubrum halophilum]|uniref:hypothetical protein n=1 Tax=Natronorubrum halophilum TaxID=1702106 RepID=UPI000EF74D51|nr:hypothetical protein [Natronorubrum halophilum]